MDTSCLYNGHLTNLYSIILNISNNFSSLSPFKTELKGNLEYRYVLCLGCSTFSHLNEHKGCFMKYK